MKKEKVLACYPGIQVATTKFIWFVKPRGLSSTEPAFTSHPTRRSQLLGEKRYCACDDASNASLALSLYDAP